MGSVTRKTKDGGQREGKRIWLEYNGRLVRCVPEQLRPASPGEEDTEGAKRKCPWSFQEATGTLKKGTFDDLVDRGVPKAGDMGDQGVPKEEKGLKRTERENDGEEEETTKMLRTTGTEGNQEEEKDDLVVEEEFQYTGKTCEVSIDIDSIEEFKSDPEAFIVGK